MKGLDRTKRISGEGGGRRPLWWAYLLIACGSLAFMIRFGNVGSFWYDEFAQICFSGLDKTLAQSALTPDPTPPLFNVLANVWYHAVPYGERWLLLLPQLATALAVVVMGLWGESWGGVRTGLWSALFLGFSQMVMEQCGFEFRGYGCYLLASVCVLWLHERRALEAGGHSVLYTLVLALLLYSHLFGSLIVLALGVWDLAAAGRGRRPLRRLAPYAGAGVLFLPWVGYFLAAIAPQAAGETSAWMVRPSPWEAVKLMAYLCGNHIVLCLLCLAGGWAVCRDGFGLRGRRGPEREEAERPAVLFVMAVCVCLVYLYGTIRRGYASLWEKRYFTGLFPCCAILCGYGVTVLGDWMGRWTRGRKRAVPAAVMGGIFLLTVPYFLIRTGRQDTPLAVYHHRDAAEALCRQGDIHDENVLVLSTLDRYVDGWNEYYGEKRGQREGFHARGVGQVAPEELDRYDVIYYEYGFWPEEAEKEPSVRALKEAFVPETSWDGIQLTRYVRK